MFLLALNRSIKFALQSFWRNIWLSLATIFIIFLTFLSINFIVSINAISDSAIAAVKEKIDVSVYFKPEVNENKISEIKSHLAILSQIKSIDYYSPDQNIAEFKKRHENDNLIQETLKELEGNPLGATLVVKAKNLDDYPEILKALDNPAYADLISEKSYDDNHLVISRINSVTDSIRRGAIIVSFIFIIIAVLIVFNTVRIALFTHQQEVSIMKLVGASNWFIRAPFIIESIFAGIVACLLSIGVIYLILSLVQPHLAAFFGGASFDIIGYFNHNFVFIFGGELLGIVFLNIVSSSLALGRYLDV
ncbi:MAG: permease-like cell division protein FtsX [Patescibacteria group bacterium]